MVDLLLLVSPTIVMIPFTGNRVFLFLLVKLPLGQTSTPTRQPYPPFYSLSQQSGLTDDETEEEREPSLQSTQKAILSSQTAMQKMDELLNRVDTLENSVKDTSISSSCSSADEKKRKKRLPSELCVSIFLLFSYKCINFLTIGKGCH